MTTSILVLTQAYPSLEKPYAMSYVHTRSMEYLRQGCKVTVLNFTSSIEYKHDGINVVPEGELRSLKNFDVIVSHAPNLKNHLRFLRKVRDKKLIFFFHGHEVLKANGDYPVAYKWKRQSMVRKGVGMLYDKCKLPIMRGFLIFLKERNKLGLVFVSGWMKHQFERNLRRKAGYFGESKIVPNSVHQSFVANSYDERVSKSADFVTIRPFDDSKYAVDLLVLAANYNPDKTFHLYGRGSYFEHNQLPVNMQVFDKFIPQCEIPLLLNRYKCALMPTRYDAQGVMVCEMATFGIPVITSSIEVCREMLADFDNVSLISDSSWGEELTIPPCADPGHMNLRFFSEQLVSTELDFFDEL